MSILKLHRVIDEGDIVMIWMSRDCCDCIVVTKGKFMNNSHGLFLHDDLIGKRYGTKWYSTKKKKFLYVLAPTAELWSKALKHRTQILYNTDISFICLWLDLKPGSIVIESGTGSGNLSTAISRCISPNGKLLTFELDSQRAEKAREDFKRNQIDHIVQVFQRDVCQSGFPMKALANAVFLDLPQPWEAIQSAKEAMVPNGKLCSFSPCIEQVQRTVEKLRETKFSDIITLELVWRPYEVRRNTLSLMNIVNSPTSSESHQSELSIEIGNNLITKNEAVSKQVVETSMTLALSGPGKDQKNFSDKPDAKRFRREPPENTTSSLTLVTARPLAHIAGHTGFLTLAKSAVSFSGNHEK